MQREQIRCKIETIYPEVNAEYKSEAVYKIIESTLERFAKTRLAVGKFSVELEPNNIVATPASYAIKRHSGEK